MNGSKYLVFANDGKMRVCMKTLEDNGRLCVAADEKLLREQLEACRNIILPLPTVKNGFISSASLTLGEFCGMLSPEHRVFYGNLKNPDFPCESESYYFDEDFLFKNSRLTAQGTLRIILENFETDLTALSVAVLGYGRCGKAICSLLSLCGCNVTSFSRRDESVAEALHNGISAEKLEKINDTLHRYDVTVNTIPSHILGGCLVNLTEENTYIEIASKPYGFDSGKSSRYRFRYISAESLPGRFTPLSAGINIAETVMKKE